MNFAIIDQSTIVRTGEAQAMVAACSLQLRRDVAPIWGRLRPKVILWPSTMPLLDDQFQIVLFDDADQAQALGWHAVSPKNGQPFGRVFVKPILQAGGQLLTGPVTVSSVLSHELCEMLIDPFACDWTRADVTINGQTCRAVAKEICDPVEADFYPIILPSGGEGVSVSNFVFPAWFNAAAQRGTKFDMLDNLSGPLSCGPGGYMMCLDELGQVRQVFGDEQPAPWRAAMKSHAAARTARRHAWSFSSSQSPT